MTESNKTIPHVQAPLALAAAHASKVDHGESVLGLVEERFGEPLPELVVLGEGRMPTPADLARSLIRLLDYYARVYEGAKDEVTRQLAEAVIRQYWGHSGSPPHIRFAWMVLEMAPMTRQADLSRQSVARALINVFGVTYPKLAVKLEEDRVQAALEATARGDGRKYRGEAHRWKALAEAWATTGDAKKWTTFKTDWFKEKGRNAQVGRWLANR